MSDSDVSVKFGAQIDGLVAGVNEAKESIESITAPIEGITSSFQGLAEVAGAAFALDGITEAIEKYAELGEQIEHTARITGSSVDEVEEFQFAVKMSGGDAETATASLNRFGRNVADASRGSGTAAEAFNKLGVSIADSSGQVRPLMDVLGDVAERFSQTADGATKLEYATALGGRGFASMIPYLDQGREGLERLKEELDETGAKMSPEQAERAEGLKQSLNVLDSSWTGLKNTMADDAAPAFKLMVDLTTELVEGINNAAKAAANSTGIFHSTFGALGTTLQIIHNQSVMNARPQRGANGGYNGEPEGGMSMEDMYAQSVQGIGEKPSLTPLEGKTSGAADGDKTEEQIERNNYQTALELDKLRLDNRKQTDEAMVASGKLSAFQQIADLQQMAAQEYALEVQAVDQLAGTYDTDSAEYAALQNKKLILTQQYNNELARLAEQQAAAQKKQYEAELQPWKQLMGDMGGAADSMISGVLMGTQTLSQALARSFSDIGVKFAEILAKMTAEFAVFSATSGKGLLGFGATNPFGAIGGVGSGAAGAAAGGAGNAATQALTTAITGNTASTAQNTTSILQQLGSMLQSVAQTLGLTTATAAQTTATTANATAATAATTATTGLIPMISANIAALSANTSALFTSHLLPSYDVGSWSIPQDQIAMVHAGEMIVPAAAAAQIRNGSASLGAPGTAMGGGGGGNFNININAIDTQTGAQFLKQNASVIAQTLSVQMRNGNNSLTSALRS